MPAVREIPIRRCLPSEDVVSFSECRNNLSANINRVRETRCRVRREEPIVSACGF